MGTEELLIRINGNAKNFTDELDKVKKKTADLEKGLASVAKASTIAFAAFGAVIAGVTLRFAAFEKGFTNVQTLLDKSSFSTKTLKEGIDDLKSGLIKLSTESGESFEILNQGLFDLVSAGVPAEQAIDRLRIATDLAAAGATNTAIAVKALSASTTAFGDSAGGAQAIAEKFFIAQKNGLTTEL